MVAFAHLAVRKGMTGLSTFVMAWVIYLVQGVTLSTSWRTAESPDRFRHYQYPSRCSSIVGTGSGKGESVVLLALNRIVHSLLKGVLMNSGQSGQPWSTSSTLKATRAPLRGEGFRQQ